MPMLDIKSCYRYSCLWPYVFQVSQGIALYTPKSGQNQPKGVATGPNLIHAHPLNPCKYPSMSGGLHKRRGGGGGPLNIHPPSLETCLMARNGGMGGGYIISPWSSHHPCVKGGGYRSASYPLETIASSGPIAAAVSPIVA